MTPFVCRVGAHVQAWRIAAASLFTPIGRVPAGNTGGANVGGFRRLPVAHDLQRTLDAARAGERERRTAACRRLTATSAIAVAAASGLIGMGGCSAPPKDLDLSLDKASAAGLYRVALLPPAQAPAVNQMHSWKVLLATPDGTPVHGATFAVDGGMPQHGHGLPTQPRVTRELGDGSYRLDGMKFSMTGWWEVKLDIHGPQGGDRVTFNTVVDRPSERR